MNEDQIRSELERRAAASSSRPDWARLDLLPAVREDIDRRPQRVTTKALLSPRLGVVAVIAALVVMVVAVPRLAPQPPTSSGSPSVSPTATPVRVMSPAELFDGWWSGELRGQTVLVEGSIKEGFTTSNARPPCLPPNPCPWGALSGIDPGLAVYARRFAVREGGEGLGFDGLGWQHWSLPQVPVSGTLAISVRSDNLVVFEGLVLPSATGLEWSVSEVATLDPSTLGPDATLLVRGALKSEFPPGTVVDRWCPMQRYSDLFGLPTRFCFNRDFLTSEGPGGGQTDVQHGAPVEFGADEEALYAISPRLYGGGCAAEPPCWFWDVVARVDEAPVPEPTPTPAPTQSTLPITHTCAGDMSVGPVELYDNAGLIESCSVETVDWPGEPLVVSDASRGVVRAVYSDGCAGASEARLDIWARSALAWPGQPPYVLSVDLESPRAPLVCRAEVVAVAIDITFMNAALAPMSLAKDVEAFLTADGRGTDSGSTDEHPITLEIAAEKSVYVEGEAVEVQSSVVSATDVTLTCPFGPVIGLEQLDGRLRFAPGPFILRCSPTTKELHGGEILTSEFSGSPWGSTEPNPLQPYLREGKLYLPPGTYRFASSFSFGLGDIPDFGHVELRASVVVRVVPSPSPTPIPAPIDAIDCGRSDPSTSIVNTSELVVSCRPLSADETRETTLEFGPGVVAGKVGGDPTRWRLLLGTTICTHDVWLTVGVRGDDKIDVEISPSAQCMLTAARLVPLEVVFTRPVDVVVVRAAPD
jgi:hypothetical protein